MNVKLHQVILPVPDFKRAVEFYRHLLGIEGRTDSLGRQDFNCGGLILTCIDPKVGGEEFAVSPPQHLRFSVEDPESMFQRAQDAGCTFQDDQMITEPWGDRFFTAQDPFGNWLGFSDTASAQRSLSECNPSGLDHHLRTGKKLSLKCLNREDDQEVFASIAKVFHDRLWLKLSEASPESLFKEDDGIRIQYWDVDSAYYSDTRVCEISSSDDTYMAIDLPEEATQLSRRSSPRVQTQAPFTLSTLDTSQASTLPAQAIAYQMFDLGIGGMRFETDLPLEKGNQLSLELSLPERKDIQVTLEVVTVEQVDREGKTVNSVGTTFVALKLEDQIKILQFLVDSSDKPMAASEEQQEVDSEESDVPADALDSEAMDSRQSEPESDTALAPLTFPTTEEKDSEIPTADSMDNDEDNLPPDYSRAVTAVQKGVQDDDVKNVKESDEPSDSYFQVVSSS
ncbi:MAG: VOC family protein [Acidobacteriota bacterium]